MPSEIFREKMFLQFGCFCNTQEHLWYPLLSRIPASTDNSSKCSHKWCSQLPNFYRRTLPEAQLAFDWLNKVFTFVPILVQLDASKPFLSSIQMLPITQWEQYYFSYMGPRMTATLVPSILGNWQSRNKMIKSTIRSYWPSSLHFRSGANI